VKDSDRFSEKSFEIRFCAALSAALDPGNRNPLWIGLTQAEERRKGFDTMLEKGGRLLIFQFKAKSRDGKFHIEREQWEVLSRIAPKTKKSAAKSVFYVFPDISILGEAKEARCILEKSWLSEVSPLSVAFRNDNVKSACVSLNVGKSWLERNRPSETIKVKESCKVFGKLFSCFCDCSKSGSIALSRYEKSRETQEIQYLHFSREEDYENTYAKKISRNRAINLGIRIASLRNSNVGSSKIESSEGISHMESLRLYEELEKQNLEDGKFICKEE